MVRAVCGADGLALMARHQSYAARQYAHSAEARACWARIPRPAAYVQCPDCLYHDGALCREGGTHVWPIQKRTGWAK